MKPPAIPYNASRLNPTPVVPLDLQPAIAAPLDARTRKVSSAGSGSGSDTGSTSKPKVTRSMPLTAPLHQPILMRRPHGDTVLSSTLPIPVKAISESSTRNDHIEDGDENDLGEGSLLGPEEKKQLKRAANRRSAQLSRKRKKQFIEELNKENDELRRKEQILRSIPDLVLVFDSAGKLWFVSHSVNHFLKYTPTELEGTSLWDRLCDESVRLLKSAFMDALAARTVDSETTPLGSGVWELRMQDKDGTHKWVVLNGVVHFSGDAPECVCSIRPRDRPTSLCQKPSLISNTSDQRQISCITEVEPQVQHICKQRKVCHAPLHESDQPGASDQQVARIIAAAGRLVQISDSSSVISVGTSDQ